MCAGHARGPCRGNAWPCWLRPHPTESICAFSLLPPWLADCALPGQGPPAFASGPRGGGWSASAAVTETPRASAGFPCLMRWRPMVVAGTPGHAALSRSPVAPGALGRHILVEVGLRQRGESWCGARPAGGGHVVCGHVPAAWTCEDLARGRPVPCWFCLFGALLSTFLCVHAHNVQHGGSVMTSIF